MTVHLKLGFRELCLITAGLPLITLLLCFIYAIVFQFDEVHETHCQVNSFTLFFLFNNNNNNQTIIFRYSMLSHR